MINIKKAFAIAGISLVLWGCSATNTTKNQKLIEAASNGNAKEVEKLLLAGADINSKNSMGYTAYMAASTNGHLEAMDVLKKAGAKRLTKEEE